MAEPSEKAHSLSQFLDELAMNAFGRSRTEAIRQGICVDCGNPVTNFHSTKTHKEYCISGLCESCQAKAFQNDGGIGDL